METLYHLTNSMNYAMGTRLEECHDMVKIIGNIVTPITKLHGQIAVDTKRGLVIIPFNSIVHMHPQY